MDAENAKGPQKRLVRELRRARKDARKADARLGATARECARIADECQEACERLAAAVVLMDRVVVSIGEATVALHAAAAINSSTAQGADNPGPARDADRRLEQLLLAQRRTNELLELALGVAFDVGME